MRAVNLLPRHEPRRRRARVAVGVQLAILSPFVVASMLAAAYLLASSKVNDNRATLKALQGQLAALPAPANPAQTNVRLALQHDQRVDALVSALRPRIAWDRILREISSVLPEDVWLTMLSATSPPSPAATPAAPPPTTTTATTTTTPAPTPAPTTPTTTPLDLNGYTYSQEGVARFLSRLAVVPELQDVKLVSSTRAIVSGRAVVQFSIQAELERVEAT